MPHRSKEAALLRQRAGIGHNGKGVHLQMVIIVKAKGLMLDDTLVQLKAGSGQTVSRAGMAGIENRHIVLFRHLINRREERQEILLRVNVFLPMGGKQDIFLRFQSQLIQNIRLLDLRQILVQHLCHGTARYIHPFLGKAALMEIFSGMLGICQVHIGNDIHDPPVRLLRQALVLAAVSQYADASPRWRTDSCWYLPGSARRPA